MGSNQQTIEKQIRQLYRQVQFLNARQQAYEMLLNSKWDILKALWNPNALKADVDKYQLAILQKHDEDMKKRAQEAMQEAQKPKLIVPNAPNGIKPLIAIALVLSLFQGCVSKSYHKKEMKRAYDEAKEGSDFQYAQANKNCEKQMEILNQKLRQAKNDKKPVWRGDVSKPVTGNEGWMK